MNSKNIFLLDGIGAVVSALMTGLLLPIFSIWTGLPRELTFLLALPAVAFAIYSLSVFWLVDIVKPWMLVAIIFANLSYCALVIAISLIYDPITIWGQAYFVAEVLVVVGVVGFEWQVYRRLLKTQAKM
jgi:hypothetical protein